MPKGFDVQHIDLTPILTAGYFERLKKLIWLFIAGIVGLIPGIAGIVWWVTDILAEAEQSGINGSIFISTAFAQTEAVSL